MLINYRNTTQLILESLEGWPTGVGASVVSYLPGREEQTCLRMKQYFYCLMRKCHYSRNASLTSKVKCQARTMEGCFIYPTKENNQTYSITFVYTSFLFGVSQYFYRPSRYNSEALSLWPHRCNIAKPTRCCNNFPQIQSNSCKKYNCVSGCSFYRSLSR
jgi:hypothetical protein